MAATLALLTCAALCIQSFARLVTVDLGFDPRSVLTFNIVGIDDTRFQTRSQRDQAVEAVLARLERAPQIAAAGAVFQRPFEHGPIGMDARFALEGQPDTVETRQRNPLLNHESVSGHYFKAMGIRLLRGRLFDRTDQRDASPVAIVSEAMAARVWPGQDPLGRRLKLAANEEGGWTTVVGVVVTARYREIEAPRLDIYLPLRQADTEVQHFMVRTTISPLSYVSTIAREIAAVDAGLSLGDVTTMEDIVRRVRGPWRFTMQVFAAFGLIAVELTAAGLFGLVAYEASRRAHEIGIRVALGATSKDVVWLMIRRAATPTAVGLGLGLMVSLAGTRALSSMLFETSATDPVTLSAMVILLAFVGLMASYFPARQAAAADPRAVLREG